MRVALFLFAVILCFTSLVPIQKDQADPVQAEIAAYHLTNVDTLVDIGCQDGLFSREVAKFYPSTFLILEDLEEYTLCAPGGKHCITRNTLKWVKKKFKNAKEYPGIEERYRFIAGRIDSIPLSTSNYSRVLCRRTLHEFEARDKMVKELYRILKPNGIVTIVEAAPNYPGQTDMYCNKKYLTKEEILASMGSFALIDTKVIPYNEGKLVIYNFTK